MWFKASAPGSLMMLGEYAVLEGGHALVAAVNQRMTVCLLPRLDTTIRITSQLGIYENDIAHIDIHPPFQFVLTALKKYQDRLSSGCDLDIHSEFSDQMGFGSSAAVTVATLHVLHKWLQITVSDEKLIQEARELVRDVQGIGSGADVAACVLGGVVAYRAEPFLAEKIPYQHPITVVYSGSKTKTVDAIHYVTEYFSGHSDIFQKMCDTIDACAQAGIRAAKENNHVELGKIMRIQQGLMESLGVNTPVLQGIIDALRKTTLGAKISGSGLGDCVIGLGATDSHSEIKITLEGVRCEKN